MTTTELFDDINDMICLGPSAQYALKNYLKHLDGKTLVNDIEDDKDEEEI